MGNNESIRKEDISISYIQAVAAVADISLDIQRHDEDSVDVEIRKDIQRSDGEIIRSSIHIQLKSTSSLSQYTDNGNTILYKLKSKNHKDLCRSSTTPIILCLLILPEDDIDWVNVEIDKMIIKECMYWKSFNKCTPTKNANSVTVEIDKNQRIDTNSLNQLLLKVAEDGELC